MAFYLPFQKSEYRAYQYPRDHLPLNSHFMCKEDQRIRSDLELDPRTPKVYSNTA